MNLKPQSIGGQVTAKIQRQKAIDNYYSNPNYCLYCKKTIEIRPFEKVATARKKKFCTHKCAATHNNILFPKRTKKDNSVPNKPVFTIESKNIYSIGLDNYYNNGVGNSFWIRNDYGS